MHPRKAPSLIEKQIGRVGQQILGFRAPGFPTPPCHPLPAPSEVPSFRHQPATSQREETWARPTASATLSLCWLHLPFPQAAGEACAMQPSCALPQCHPEPPIVTMAVKSLYQEGQAESQCEGTKAARSPNCLHDKSPLKGAA